MIQLEIHVHDFETRSGIYVHFSICQESHAVDTMVINSHVSIHQSAAQVKMVEKGNSSLNA
jgi:hypothetical protein